MADEPMEDLFGRVLGEFILRDRIDEGGHGIVYRCEQPLLKRDVVVKVLRNLPLHKNNASRERFLREAQLASQLDHPYAAHIYAFGAEDDGLLWLAMELVRGVSLSTWLANHGPMPLEQFVPFFACVAQVVHAAHELGIVHRDLKPSNMMVIERGGQLFPKLLDFGVAKRTPLAVPPPEPAPTSGPDIVETSPTPLRVLRDRPPHVVSSIPGADDGRLTHPGARFGSAPYMSPEQWIDAHTVGPAADIYSLGILVYEALTGHKPFIGANLDEFYWHHRHSEPPSLGEGFAPSLDRVVQRALSKEADKRQATALELASELQSALRALPDEQLKARADVWEISRASSMMLSRAELKTVSKPAPSPVAGQLVEASRRRLVIRNWLLSGLAATAASLAVGGVWYFGSVNTELAKKDAQASKQAAEATLTQSELEQGRSALLHNEPDAARHLAEAYRRDPNPSTEFMLARAMQPRLAEQCRFPSTFGRMWSANFSPDGTQTVTTDDRNAQIWDATTHQRRFLLPHGTEVYEGVYSADGKRIATAARDAVRIWDATTGALVLKLAYQRKGGGPADYFVVAISPDGTLVAAMNAEGSPDPRVGYDTRPAAGRTT